MGRTVAKVPLEVLSTNGRLAPFLTVHFADRSTCQTVHFLRERLRTDQTDASRGVTPKKRTAVRLPNRPLDIPPRGCLALPPQYLLIRRPFRLPCVPGTPNLHDIAGSSPLQRGDILPHLAYGRPVHGSIRVMAAWASEIFVFLDLLSA